MELNHKHFRFGVGTFIKEFSCHCRKWTITNKDKPEIPDPKIAWIIHDCDELTVYQQFKGLNRYYVKKIK